MNTKTIESPESLASAGTACWAAFLGRIEHEVHCASERYRDADTAYKAAVLAVDRGSMFRDVTACRLHRGRFYVVRRVWPDGTHDDPAIATWTCKGWKVVHGCLITSTASGASIQVWVTDDELADGTEQIIEMVDAVV